MRRTSHILAAFFAVGLICSIPAKAEADVFLSPFAGASFLDGELAKGTKGTFGAGIGVAAFFCFMFSWVELLLAKTLTAVAAKPIAAAMTKTASTSGYELGLLAAAGVLTIVPGAFVIYFVRNYIAKGFALGRV